MTASTRINILTFVGASLLPFASPLAAQAVSVNVGGIDYEVFFTTTSYDARSDLFGSGSPGQMPWWDSAVIAYDFALAVYDQLGENVYQAGYGPVFAYDYNSAVFGGVYGLTQNTLDINEQLDIGSANPLAANQIYPYAYATSNTPVPAPMPLFGAAAAFGWARRLRNNRRLINSKMFRVDHKAGSFS
jgi:hypothetical protein